MQEALIVVEHQEPIVVNKGDRVEIRNLLLLPKRWNNLLSLIVTPKT